VPEPYTPAIRGRGDSHDLEYRQDGIANAVLTPNGGRGGIGVGAIAFSAKDHGADAGDIAPTLRAGTHDKSHANGGCMPAVAFDARQSDVLQYGEKTGPLDTDGHPIAVQSALTVRRLTPRECCRLMGFPDSYLDITYRGKPAADGNKYKALGNSMAVPVMRWIGERIKMVNDLCS
jgi:DNA (cytosine-5)-methyltransferase 1